MSDDRHQGDKPKAAKAFDAFAVRNDKDGKGHFHKIGAAFAHKDGEGYDINMAATPTNGRLLGRTLSFVEPLLAAIADMRSQRHGAPVSQARSILITSAIKRAVQAIESQSGATR